MNIRLTPEQADLVNVAIETGRVSSVEQAVQQAMALWVDFERRRTELLDRLEAAETSLSRGEGLEMNQTSTDALVDDLIERNRHRFAVTLSKAD